MDRVTIPRNFIDRFRAPGYNIPHHGAMFVSQWAHMLYMGNIISYDKYVLIQNLAYSVLDVGDWRPE